MSSITYPSNLTPGTTNLSAQVNANFAAVAAIVNGQLDSTNLKLSAGITVNQLGLNPGGEAFNKSGSGTLTWASGLTTDSVPRVAMTTDKGIEFGPGGSGSLDTGLVRSAASTIQINDTAGGPGNLDLNGGLLLNATITFSSISVSGTLSSGTNGGTGGQLTLFGSTSGSAVIKVAAAAGTTNFTLPVGNGSPGQALVTDGAGNLSYMSIGAASQAIGPFSVPANSSVPKAHSLGVVPTYAAMLLTCTSNDNGYVVGNNAYIAGDASSQVGIYLQNLNATQVSVGSNATTEIGNRVINLSKWTMMLYLFA